MHEKKSLALEVPLYMMGDIPQLISYLSKQLDNTTEVGHPVYKPLLLLETEKFTLGQPIVVYFPH
jgi:hypothetical protein